MLAASTTTLPLFLALSACAGPNPLAGPPPLSADVRGLLAAVTDEQNLIWIYKRTMATYSPMAPALAALLAEHQAHLAQLRRLAHAAAPLAQLYASIAASESTHVSALIELAARSSG